MDKEKFKKYLIEDIKALMDILKDIDYCTTYSNSIDKLSAFSTTTQSLDLKKEQFREFVKTMKNVKI